jgi:hypothetical protein
VRIAYLDEGGIGKVEVEPFLVVTGVVLNPDVHYRTVVEELDKIRQRLPSHRRRAIFHAKDLLHGTGEFPKEEWPNADDRFDILLSVARVIERLNLPIIFGAVRRQLSVPGWTGPYDERRDSHVVGAIRCTMQLEAYMREIGTDEMAQLVFEQNEYAQRSIQLIHDVLSLEDLAVREYLDLDAQNVMPYTRIIDTPLFARKSQSAPLQLADICAVAMKRYLQRSKNSDILFNIIRPHIREYVADKDVPFFNQA